MAKNNAFLAKVRRAQVNENFIRKLFTIQQCKDMMLIAASDALGCGAERLKKLSESFDEAYSHYMRGALEEDNGGKGDRELTYTRESIDRKLKEICGKYFQPWEERYNGKC